MEQNSGGNEEILQIHNSCSPDGIHQTETSNFWQLTGKGRSESFMDHLSHCDDFLDILPDPPDGTPVIESITGKTITLSWKKPRRLDPSIGTQDWYLKGSQFKSLLVSTLRWNILH